MKNALFLTLVAGALSFACQHGSPADTTPKVFNKKGGIVFLGGSAAWDEDEVVGPLVSMSRRSDGSWGGRINNEIIDVNVYSGRLGGSGMTMKWREENGKLVISGAYRDRPYRFEVMPDHVAVRMPSRSYDLPHRADWSYGPGGELKFEGEAQKPTQPMPQFGIAMLATFIATEAQMRDSSGDPGI